MAPAAYNYEFFAVTFPADFVAHVEIDRPKKLNAFKQPMWTNLYQLFNRLSVDPDVRCVVLSGRGDKAFTAGLDVEAASADGITSEAVQKAGSDPARTAFTMREHILEYQEAVSAVERCRKPVIVAIHGYAYGLAIDLSTAADIRICATDTKFCVKETDIGLAADVGTLSRLPKSGVPISWAKDVCYTARVFGAEEALRVGLVSDVAPSKAEALEMAVQKARVVAAKSPVAVQGTKHLLDFSRDHGVEEGLRYTAVWNMAMLQTDDVKRAMLSGLRKQKAEFAKL